MRRVFEMYSIVSPKPHFLEINFYMHTLAQLIIT